MLPGTVTVMSCVVCGSNNTGVTVAVAVNCDCLNSMMSYTSVFVDAIPAFDKLQ